MHSPIITLYLIGVAVMLALVLVATAVRQRTMEEKKARYGTFTVWLGLVAVSFGSWISFLWIMAETCKALRG
jgi:uncharacterized membrane protein